MTNNRLLPQKIKAVSKEIIVSTIKVQLSLLPIVGNVINEALFEMPEMVKQERINRFISAIEDRFKKHENTLGSIDLYNESFSDLIRKIFKKVAETNSVEKIRLFADIIFNSMQINLEEEGERYERSVEIISTLSDSELTLLRSLIKEYEFKGGIDSDYFFGMGATQINYMTEITLGLPTKESRICIELLINKGLVADAGLGKINYIPRSYIGYTPLGSDLIRFIAEIDSTIL
jgi:hypothetical protein